MKFPAYPKVGIFLLCCLLSLAVCSQSVSGIVNQYYKVTGINTGTNTLTLTNTTGISSGVRVLVIETKGAGINNSNSSSFGNITATGNAGNYELNTVCAINGNDVTLQYQLLNTYDVAGSVQLVTVPAYNSVTVIDTLKATAWNSASGTGGIIVLQAADTIYLNSAIDASGKGFAGGAIFNYPTPTYDCIWTTNITNYYTQVPPSPNLYYTGGKKGEGIADYILNAEYGRGKQANGGGGGNNHNSGGAGGSNYGTGGNGGQRSNESAFQCHGQYPGIGGLSLSSYGYSSGNNRIFLGGGGGSGHGNNNVQTPGGNGGGIVILIANVLISSGNKILANGGLPYNPLCADPYQAEGDGGGGGGAGGTILIKANQVTGSVIAEAIGAKGSNSSYNLGGTVNDCTGPGGGGGGGVVWVSGASLPGSLTVSVNGGSNGVVSTNSAIVACRGSANNATPGTSGTSVTGLVIPQSTAFVCAPLAVSDLEFFRGYLQDGKVQVKWKWNSNQIPVSFELERSADRIDFKTIRKTLSHGIGTYFETDDVPFPGTCFYRLKIFMPGKPVAYSAVFAIRTPGEDPVIWKGLMPNPARDKLLANFYSATHTRVNGMILDAMGRSLQQVEIELNPGNQAIQISLKSYSPGMYWMYLDINGRRIFKKFIRTV